MQKLAFAAIIVAAAFATPAFAACDTINSKTVKLSACVDENDWVLQAPTGTQEFYYLSTDERVGLFVISEAETFNTSAYRGAILENAKGGNAGAEATVVQERVENVADKPWNVLEYQFGDPEKYSFQNFYYTQPGFGSVQLVFFSTPGDATVAAYRAGKLLSTLTYGN